MKEHHPLLSHLLRRTESFTCLETGKQRKTLPKASLRCSRPAYLTSSAVSSPHLVAALQGGEGGPWGGQQGSCCYQCFLLLILNNFSGGAFFSEQYHPQLFTSLVWRTFAALRKHPPLVGCALARPHMARGVNALSAGASRGPVITTYNAGLRYCWMLSSAARQLLAAAAEPLYDNAAY